MRTKKPRPKSLDEFIKQGDKAPTVSVKADKKDKDVKYMLVIPSRLRGQLKAEAALIGVAMRDYIVKLLENHPNRLSK